MANNYLLSKNKLFILIDGLAFICILIKNLTNNDYENIFTGNKKEIFNCITNPCFAPLVISMLHFVILYYLHKSNIELSIQNIDCSKRMKIFYLRFSSVVMIINLFVYKILREIMLHFIQAELGICIFIFAIEFLFVLGICYLICIFKINKINSLNYSLRKKDEIIKEYFYHLID